ncbi:Glycosyltransferase family 8 protein [Mycena sanguinolenta]|uniref:Glycosyltransferase family 8 protein n=1 Tax=Mycena sanguinolenta TaxID=230812 RepID=A0A8H6ZG30_9AGAR|nr:Glycosyltransferase family 8 protein [Mycena sanguinolenta]
MDNYQNLYIIPASSHLSTDDWDSNAMPVTADADAIHVLLSRRAVVSSLESDGYAIGVAVAGHSARSANVTARLLLPYLEQKVSERALCITRAVGWEPYPVTLIPPPHGGKDVYDGYKEQYTKLHIWTLDKQGVDSAVYIDADTLVLRNFDELFNLPFNFAAAPDVRLGRRGFDITFNAGVLAFRPSSAVYEDMRTKVEVAKYPLQEAEQAFLNLYFGGTVLRLPYIYNGNLAIKMRNTILWRRLVEEMRVVHYTLAKPFLPDPSHSEAILTEEQIVDALEQGARRKGGIFWEEMTWWETAYRKMMVDHGHTIEQCQ